MVATELGYTIRHINNLIKNYQEQGFTAFIHKNQGRISARKTDQRIIDNILKLYQEKYQGYNFTHFQEQLKENENILLSYRLFYNIMYENSEISPKIHQTTRRKLKIIAMQNLSKPKITNLEKKIHLQSLMKLEKSHSMQNRKQEFGQRIQCYASQHF